jgi:hypothetical protein
MTFAGMPFPWPPAVDAVAPGSACGSQRPALNAAPAVAADGTVYVISRAHLNAAYGYLAAANANLNPKWNSSLRERLNDGCDVLLPPEQLADAAREASVEWTRRPIRCRRAALRTNQRIPRDCAGWLHSDRDCVPIQLLAGPPVSFQLQREFSRIVRFRMGYHSGDL